MIELVPWTASLKPDLIRICGGVDRTYLTNRIPKPYTEADADWYLNHVSGLDGTEGLFRAIVADGRCVGSISMEKLPDVYGRDAEIGYMLETSDWSKGIMTEAVRQMCELSFDVLDLARITGLVDAPNIASRRVLEKNGFLLEGIKRNAVHKSDAVYDLCIYGKLRD